MYQETALLCGQHGEGLGGHPPGCAVIRSEQVLPPQGQKQMSRALTSFIPARLSRSSACAARVPKRWLKIRGGG